MRFSRKERHLGTSVEIMVETDLPDVSEALDAAYAHFRSVEREFSRFRDDSSLSVLNREGRIRASDRFLLLLNESRSAHSATGGLFNPLVDVSRLGYSKSFDSGEFVAVDRGLSTDFGAVSTNGRTVSVEPGHALDFWGIGKGFAVDGAASLLREFGIRDFFVNAGGGDIAASGSNGSEPGWRISIENPFTGKPLASFLLSDAAVATSGSYRRKWEIDGVPRHHIVDPETGENRNALVSATLVMDRCVTADAFAKALFNLPPNESLGFASRAGGAALVVTREGEILCAPEFVEKYDLRTPEG